ncbi:TPA: uracil-DNA glycosylase family protein [Photobacterium damselae]
MNKDKTNNIIKLYIKLLEHINKRAGSNLSEKFVINEDWNNITNKLDVIFCGDNPGSSELEHKRYFVGRSGRSLYEFIYLIEEIYETKQWTFFNKTPYSSNRTNDLRKSDDENAVIRKSIHLTVKCLYKLWQINPNIKIFIFGHSSSYIVNTFKKKLKKKMALNDGFDKCVIILSHPSSRHFSADIGDYMISYLRKTHSSNKTLYDSMISDIKKDL